MSTAPIRQQMIHHRISSEPPPISERIEELLAAWDLGVILCLRELRIRYKQTALGVAWVLLQPLVPALILAAVFGSFARLPSGGAPYLLFALSGLTLYGLVSGVVTRAGTSLVRDGGLISKVYFPRSVLPLASGLAVFVDFSVGLAVVLGLMVALGQALTFNLVILPIVVTLTMVLSLAIGLAVAALTARFRDVGHAVPFAMQLLLYGSPVVYSMEVLPSSLVDWFALNPFVPLIESFRWSLLGTPAPTLARILIGLVTGIVITGSGIYVFSRASRNLADVA